MSVKVKSRSSLPAELARLASTKSPEMRAELLRRMTDVYVAETGKCSSAEQYLLDEIVKTLITKISGPDRASVSTTLSRLHSLPNTLAHTLATDLDIQVAGPIIRNYRSLPEQTLVDIARAGSQDHLRAIAGRNQITPPVTDVVVTRGDAAVVGVLAANNSARFSTSGMRTLIEKAEKDLDLQALVVDRADITLDTIQKLVPVISKELASRLRTKASYIDASLLSEHLGEWMEDRQANIGRLELQLNDIRAGKTELNQVARELIENKRLLDVTTVMAAMIDLDRFHAFNILTRGEPQAILLLMKSIELQWPVVDRFLKLRRAKMPYDYYEEAVTRDTYDGMDVATAQRVIRFMKVRRSVGGAG